MEEYHILGGKPICGEYRVQGAKNAALPILAAAIITGEENTFFNCPDISDVNTMKEILISLGCRVEGRRDTVVVDAKGLFGYRIPREMMEEIRSSVFLVGPLLARCGKAVISQPGGCAIGKRPIDIHIKALKKLGVKVSEQDNLLVCIGENLKGSHIKLDFPSVGATENIMMAALGAEGVTTVDNCAKEPEIVDLQNYLVKCGAKVRGAGTPTITIEGKSLLRGCVHKIIPDRIEAGTFLAAAAGSGGQLLLSNVVPGHMDSICRFFETAGCKIEKGKTELYLRAPKRLKPVGKMETRPYPGFPTDMQPQFTAIMTVAQGDTKIKENIFENRFRFADQLLEMGADIEIFGRKAIIKGVDFLRGSKVCAEDLRGGAALIIAGLLANGKTVVKGAEHIDRGYSQLHKSLCNLGGEIWKENEEKI